MLIKGPSFSLSWITCPEQANFYVMRTLGRQPKEKAHMARNGGFLPLPGSGDSRPGSSWTAASCVTQPEPRLPDPWKLCEGINVVSSCKVLGSFVTQQ